MLRRFPAYISVIAALIVIGAGFLSGRTPYEIAVRLVFVIAVVYLCGIVIRSYLKKRVFNRRAKSVKDDEIDRKNMKNLMSTDDSDEWI